MAVMVSLAGLLIITFALGFIFYKRMKYEADLQAISAWKVELKDISEKHLTRVGSQMTIGSMKCGSAIDIGAENQIFTKIATYKGKVVALKEIKKDSIDVRDRELLIEMKQMREMHHENINPFIGACTEAPNVYVIMMYAQKGSLQDVLHNDDIKLSPDFKIAIATDIGKGLAYLHESPFGSHGHLTSSNCVIDSRWTCKITDYGLARFKSGDENQNARRMNYSASLWTAPELLRAPMTSPYGNPEVDVYSFAIILQEIVSNDAPYAFNKLEASEIIEKVKEGPCKKTSQKPYRPLLYPETCSDAWRELMEACWAEEPELRPKFSKINSALVKLNDGRVINVIDKMVKMLEKHAEHLEELVSERTTELNEEKRKVEILLYSILPRPVAEQLKRGGTVEPESYSNVTIYFSDIVGFTTLAAQSTPLQVVNLLNDLYSHFDRIVDDFDVYKVETIGDAYMVASGLPVPNEDQHVAHIATMSLHLLSGIGNYLVPHLQNTRLQIRIGVHTGPVVAGVVGQKMPRYCLFGDTVNTASRMESNGLALRIHLSATSAALLIKIGGFILQCRGEIKIRGKDPMITYWLQGKQGLDLPLPDVSQALPEAMHEFK